MTLGFSPIDPSAPTNDAIADEDARSTPTPPDIPFVLPARTDGYAMRSRLRSRVAAFTITAALHGAALIGILVYRSADVLVSPPPPPLVVDLLPMARAPAETRKPEPRPKAIRRPAQPVTPPPIVLPIIPDIAQPPLAMTEPSPPAQIAMPAPPSPPAAPPTAAPVSEGAGKARDTWEGRVLARLERFKRYPSSARSRREQGVATIRFRLDRKGHILSSSIAHSSGNRALDAEALATLARAEPLPDIPADRPDEIELLVPIEFTIRPGS